MKSRKNEHLIPIDSILKKGKWNEYCKLANQTDDFRGSVQKNPKRYKDVCVIVPAKIAEKLGFIWKI